MKVFTAEQIRAIDAYTIAHEPIPSIDLMERASQAFANWFIQKYPKDNSIKIFAGIGNNGGDGLAVGRLLMDAGYTGVSIYAVRFSEKTSKDFDINASRLTDLHDIRSESDFPKLESTDIIIDAIFGSGLSRPVRGFTARLIAHINTSEAEIVSVDIASGLFCNEHNADQAIVEPQHTVSFQFPKMAFLLPQNEQYVGEWETVPIGLHPDVIEQTASNYEYVDRAFIQQWVKPRQKFSHKGTFGHTLIIAGSYGKIGAAVLAGKAALRNGAGLVSVHLPTCGYEIMQNSIPEVMCSIDRHRAYISELPPIAKYNAIAIGPGLDKAPSTIEVLKELLQTATQPLVIDADALNLLAENRKLLMQLPPHSILTPHPKEFERLVGKTANHYERLVELEKFSKTYGVIVVLKGAHTAIAIPSGKIYFNSTGNAGMATAGSGDVLTGMIAALAGQGYSSEKAAVLGVYLHGMAGDIAQESRGEASLIASDMIEMLGSCYQRLLKK